MNRFLNYTIILFSPFLFSPSICHSEIQICEIGNPAQGRWELIYNGISQAAAFASVYSYTGTPSCKNEQIIGSNRVLIAQALRCPKDFESHPNCPIECDLGQITACYHESYGYKPGVAKSCTIYKWNCYRSSPDQEPSEKPLNIGPPPVSSCLSLRT